MKRFLLVGTALLLSLQSLPAAAEEYTKEQIQEIVRDYLVSNPEVLMEAMVSLQNYRTQQAELENQRLIEANKDALFHNPDAASIGPKDAKVTLVEFYDYNCGACKIMYNSLLEYLKENKDLRVVFKEYPIFGESSEYPARIAIAVHRLKPEKYFEFHKELMGYQGRVNAEVTDKALEKVGLDKDKIKKEAESEKVADILSHTRDLAQTLGATGTPLLVLNSEIIPHALDIDTLRDKVTAIEKQ